MGKITYLTPIISKQQEKPSDTEPDKNNQPICIELYQKPRLAEDSTHELFKKIEKLIEKYNSYK